MNTTPDTPLTRDAIAAALTAAGFPVSPATKYAPDALLTRAATAAALTDTGFPVSPATLATQATRGGGPPYQLFGRIPLYRWGNSLAWAEDKLSPPRRSTSEVLERRADEPARENFVASKVQAA